MKKLLILFSFFALVTLIIYSCQKNNVTAKTEKPIQSLNLTSPDGMVLASSIEDLRSQMNPQISRKFNNATMAYTIENISYTRTKSAGMIADISYKIPDGRESNIIIMDGVKEKVNAHGNVRVVVDDKFSSSTNKAAPVKHSYSCSGPDCCKVHAVEHPDGSVDVDCSCGGCSMTID
jgi:hypothetical protein